MATSITMGHVKQNAKLAGISVATLAQLFGVSSGAMSNAFRGIAYLGSEREAELLMLTTRVIEMQEALRPLREPTDAESLSQLLHTTPDFIRARVTEIFGNQ